MKVVNIEVVAKGLKKYELHVTVRNCITFRTCNRSILYRLGVILSSNSEIGFWIKFALNTHLAILCSGSTIIKCVA